MPSKDKKSAILRDATSYFNKHGYQPVSLYELARSMNMSRGNLTYHFANKEALLEAIATEMWDKINKHRQKSRTLPSFENLHNEVQLYYRFQKQYQFIFLDSKVLSHPIIKRQFRKMTQQTISDNKAAIAFAIQLGNMKPEPFPGAYNNISLITWMLTFFWLPQQVIRGMKTADEGEKLIWSILVPHFTAKGLKSFKNFFGENILTDLGDAFELDVASLVNF